MRSKEINKFRKMLEAKRTELVPHLRKRDSIAIEKTPDVLDEVQLAGERELATRYLERESKILRDVRAALMRIEAGSFGACLNCEEEIGSKRLDAMPWASLCLACQERDDLQRNRHIGQSEWLPKAA